MPAQTLRRLLPTLIGISLLLAFAGAPAEAVTIDPTTRTVTSAEFVVDWREGADASEEEITSLSWNGGPDLAQNGHAYCRPNSEYWGNSWTSDGSFDHLVAGDSEGTWAAAGSDSVQIDTTITTCANPRPPVPVRTTYTFYDTGPVDQIKVSRRFSFGTDAFNRNFRPYIPRMPGSFSQVLHPDAAGSTLVTESTCGNGCRAGSWNKTWFAQNDPGTNSGVIVLRDSSSPSNAALWLDNDAASSSNAASTELLAPAGGHTGDVTETEYLCFYTSSTWTTAMRSALQLPAFCGLEPADSCDDPGATTDATDANPNNGIVEGTSGDDFLKGDADPETLNGGDGNDLICGGDGKDRLNGDGGNDDLYGEGDSDLMEGGTGGDDFSGGAGPNDRVTYSGRTSPVTVTIGAGTDDDGTTGTEGDNVQNDVEDLTGGSHNDTLEADPSDPDANSFNGSQGSDTLRGHGGNDRLNGEAHDDPEVNGGAGNDTLYGGPGNDQGPGADYGLRGGAGNDLLYGNDGDDELDGEGNDDRLEGGLGADVQSGGAGADKATYEGRAAQVVASLGTGTGDDGVGGEGDTLESDLEHLQGGNAGDILTGSDAANTLYGGAGNDELHGEGGDDTLDGGSGGDELDGGTGARDRVTYASRNAGVLVTIGAGADGESNGTEGDDVQTTVEDVVGSQQGDSLRGDADANRLYGGAGGDELIGEEGGDYLSGDAGNDTLYGRNESTPVDGVRDDLLCGADSGIPPRDSYFAEVPPDRISGCETNIASTF